ncbi:MAG: recombinase family protein [Defluviitaleaceae bacterium]|nr:recombinase family protein [Defluviitaleaceae bacterium]
MKRNLRVAAYCRVSTDKDDQVNSLNSQRQYFMDYIKNQKGWILVNIYYDEGISGTSTKKRKGFNSMIAEARMKNIDMILTKEISRFARNTLDSLKYTRELKNLGIGVLFIADNINTLDPDSELRLTIMSSIAQEESRKTSERVKWGQTQRMKAGVVFGRDMLGYFVKDGKLIINHDETETVRLIFHKFLNENKGTHVIARELQEAGLRPKRAGQWSNVTILRVLRNEKYVGDLLQKKTFTPDYLTHEKKYNRGHEDMIYLRDHHEPIISRQIWEETQKELTRRSPTNEQKSKHSNRYWCSGKLVCGECGKNFVSRKKKLKNGEVYKAWSCGSFAINEKVVIACVKFVITHIGFDKEKIVKELSYDIKTVLSQDVKSMDVKKLHGRIGDINNKKEKAINAMFEGTINKDDLKLMNERYDNDIAAIKAQLQISGSLQQNIVALNDTCVAEIRSIAGLNSKDEMLYRELVNKAIIRNDNLVDIFISSIPFGVRVRWESSGKMEKYNVDVSIVDVLVKTAQHGSGYAISIHI